MAADEQQGSLQQKSDGHHANGHHEAHAGPPDKQDLAEQTLQEGFIGSDDPSPAVLKAEFPHELEPHLEQPAKTQHDSLDGEAHRRLFISHETLLLWLAHTWLDSRAQGSHAFICTACSCDTGVRPISNIGHPCPSCFLLLHLGRTIAVPVQARSCWRMRCRQGRMGRRPKSFPTPSGRGRPYFGASMLATGCALLTQRRSRNVPANPLQDSTRALTLWSILGSRLRPSCWQCTVCCRNWGLEVTAFDGARRVSRGQGNSRRGERSSIDLAAGLARSPQKARRGPDASGDLDLDSSLFPAFGSGASPVSAQADAALLRDTGVLIC